MKISRESAIIAAIGIADLITTLLWVRGHGAQEANPLFARYLAMGFGWFVLMKIVLLAAPILILEWARSHRPLFTRWASQFAILAYVTLYGVGVAHLNAETRNSLLAGVAAKKPAPPPMVYVSIPICTPDGRIVGMRPAVVPPRATPH